MPQTLITRWQMFSPNTASPGRSLAYHQRLYLPPACWLLWLMWDGAQRQDVRWLGVRTLLICEGLRLLFSQVSTSNYLLCWDLMEDWSSGVIMNYLPQPWSAVFPRTFKSLIFKSLPNSKSKYFFFLFFFFKPWQLSPLKSLSLN